MKLEDYALLGGGVLAAAYIINRTPIAKNIGNELGAGVANLVIGGSEGIFTGSYNAGASIGSGLGKNANSALQSMLIDLGIGDKYYPNAASIANNTPEVSPAQAVLDVFPIVTNPFAALQSGINAFSMNAANQLAGWLHV